MELHGYIIPDSLNKELAMTNPNTQLENTVGQILFDEGDDIGSDAILSGTETSITWVVMQISSHQHLMS